MCLKSTFKSLLNEFKKIWCLIAVLGNELYQKTIEECEKERQQNVTEVEQRAWRLASEEKVRALKAAKEAAEVELDKALAAAKKAQVGINFKMVHSRGMIVWGPGMV